MGAMASQITSLANVDSSVYSATDEKTSKLRVTGLCVGIHRWPVNSPHKWPVMRKIFPFDDVIMLFMFPKINPTRQVLRCYRATILCLAIPHHVILRATLRPCVATENRQKVEWSHWLPPSAEAACPPMLLYEMVNIHYMWILWKYIPFCDGPTVVYLGKEFNPSLII